MNQTKKIKHSIMSCFLVLALANFMTGCASKQVAGTTPRLRIKEQFANYPHGTSYQKKRKFVRKQAAHPTQKQIADRRSFSEEQSVSYHTIQKGETLYAISRSYDISPKQLIAYNNFDDIDVIRVGQRIKIPVNTSAPVKQIRLVTQPDQPIKTVARVKPKVIDYKPLPASTVRQTTTYAIHTVKRGDNIWRVAQKYDITVDDLCRINEITRNTQLAVGEKIKIPIE